ncbi:MAG: YihY/virulence factor BrkB family protein [Methyloceanibacter sp.]|uniref:YihY/virulence factor BrkB family protein n=1 Tax=Methyloceanibacter sp. TaxID=1965321 RepID=UPI003EE37363
MASQPRANTPLWLDLLIASGAIGGAYALDRYVLPQPKKPRDKGRDKGTDLPADSADAPEETPMPAEAPEESPDTGSGAMETRPSQEPEQVQHARSHDRGRGRRATGPHKIPAKGWMDVGYRVFTQISEDRLLAVAAGAVFYMLLALFPAVTALVSLYGLYSDPVTINQQLSLLSGVMPASGIDIVREQVTRLAETSNSSLSFGFLFGLGLALWSANAGMKAIIDSLNVVYDEREKRGFVHLTLVAFAFTLGALVCVLLALSAIVVLPLVLAWVGLDTQMGLILSWLRWPALLLVVLVALSVLYRYGPSRARARWRWLSVGAVFATVAWLLGSALFSWYLSNFANYDATYGSLGAAIGLMMWLWMSVIVILVGGELNAELEHQTAEDTTTTPEKPLGQRGATMADAVGKAWR